MKNAWHPPKRALGQHFLADLNTARWIVRQAEVLPSDRVIEIGPGRGMLTRALLLTGAEIFAVEKDEDLTIRLRETFGGEKNVTILQGDATQVSWESLSDSRHPAILMGNLPYNVSTQILWRLLSQTHLFKRWFFLFQKEVADRFCANVGTASYGALSVFVQSVTHPSLLRIFPPHYFIPAPKVDSALVAFQMKSVSRPTPMEDRLFIQLVKAAFSHRRKMLRNNLKHLFQSPVAMDAAFDRVGITGTMRAQELTLRHYLELAEYLRRAS